MPQLQFVIVPQRRGTVPKVAMHLFCRFLHCPSCKDSCLVWHGGRERVKGCVSNTFPLALQVYFCLSCHVFYKTITLAPLSSGFWLDGANGRGLQKARGRKESGGICSLPSYELGSGYILLQPSLLPLPQLQL